MVSSAIIIFIIWAMLRCICKGASDTWLVTCFTFLVLPHILTWPIYMVFGAVK